MKIYSTLLFVFLFVGFSYSQEKVTQADLTKLKGWMAGAFNSKEQSKNDSDFFEIHLHMKPIWADRKDGFWLYVEQAIISALDKPYRQRVYNVNVLNDTTIVSKVYTFFGSGQRFAGEWKKENPLQNLTLDSLEDRKGCSIFLKKSKDNYFFGSTNKNDCESNLRGAKYATSKVKITEADLNSWDQGFDENGKQIWGAVKGGYQFIKQKE